MSYLLGIDASTTATKALLIDETGEVVSVASSGYDYETPHPLWTEQEPALWWEAAVQSIRKLLAETRVAPESIIGIGLTGQMHGLVLLDEDGNVIRKSILWNDQRTGAQCDTIRRVLGKDRLIQITGNDALTGFTAPKILWVKENEPEYFERTRHILLPKDYLRFRLTGEYATDKAGAAGTLLMNVRRRDWSRDLLDALEIPDEWMPPTFEGTDVTGRVSRAAAEITGLREGTPVVAGGGDQAAGAVGVGAIREGIVAVTLGTSGVVFASANEPFIEPEGRLHAFCHAVPNRWHLMGVMLSAAGSLRWYRDTIAPGVDFGELVKEAERAPVGSDGLLFLPYLTGERTPYPDPNLRGGFVGLTVRHQRAHLTRSVLEGVAFGLRDIFSLMQDAGLAAPDQVRVSGGGARSDLWRQIIADVLNAELVTVNTTEGAAYGAALLAGVGAGVWSSVDSACDATIRVTGSTAPRVDDTPTYSYFHQRYRDLYPALKDHFDRLSQTVEV
ncbi:MAG TPA: xylulokinase [Rhodothermales bacterium]